MHNQESRAEINEASGLVLISEYRWKFGYHLLLAIIHIDELLIRFNHFEALTKLCRSKLFAHVGTKLLNVAAGYIDHFLIGHWFGVIWR